MGYELRGAAVGVGAECEWDLLRRYAYGLNRISITASNKLYYYGTDLLGSVTALGESTGTSAVRCETTC